MRVPVGPPAKPVAITGWPSVLSVRATLTPLPPGIVRLLDRAVAAAEPEVRHRQRLVDRRVEGDGDDHAIRPCPSAARCGGAARRRHVSTSYRLQTASTASSSTSRTAAEASRPARSAERAAPGPARAVTSGDAVDDPAAPAHHDRPDARARGQRPLELVGRAVGASRDALAAPRDARTVRAGHERRRRSSRYFSAGAADDRAALRTGASRVVAAQAVAQQRERVRVARAPRWVAEHGADDRDAVARAPSRRGCSRRVDVWPVLTPLTYGHRAHERVAVDDRARARRRCAA